MKQRRTISLLPWHATRGHHGRGGCTRGHQTEIPTSKAGGRCASPTAVSAAWPRTGSRHRSFFQKGEQVRSLPKLKLTSRTVTLVPLSTVSTTNHRRPPLTAAFEGSSSILACDSD